MLRARSRGVLDAVHLAARGHQPSRRYVYIALAQHGNSSCWQRLTRHPNLTPLLQTPLDQLGLRCAQRSFRGSPSSAAPACLTSQTDNIVDTVLVSTS